MARAARGLRRALSHAPDHLGASADAFHGPYAALRRALDYTYHAHFGAARQSMQDAIVARLVAGGASSAAPWAVFTAGPMGGGKGHVLRWLHARGAFPLARFVHVDPDAIKAELPEAPALAASDPAFAATRLHRESGYIAELAEHAAMAASRHVLVDGSLRDAGWYAGVFARVRRAARRSQATGRVVPRAVLEAAVRDVPRSVALLAPLADAAVTVANDADGADPVVRPPHSLATVAALFAEHDGVR
jgi:hypothetical protein